mgnify:CR=1 FL=1
MSAASVAALEADVADENEVEAGTIIQVEPEGHGELRELAVEEEPEHDHAGYRNERDEGPAVGEGKG